jgi:23S rRNA pseudouridine2605 synthase
MRINKFLSSTGVASRRKSEELVRAGRVSLNGIAVTDLSTTVDPAKDIILLDGKQVESQKKQYFLLNKPWGYVSTNEDEHARKKVFDLMPDREGLFIVGRLDKDSEGLMILTNDGDFAQEFSHPKGNHEKEYIVDVCGKETGFSTKLDNAIKYFKCGIYIDGYKTRPADAKVISQSESKKASFKIVLREGRKRQIRRTFEKADLNVTALKRVRIDKFQLGNLESGEFKEITF